MAIHLQEWAFAGVSFLLMAVAQSALAFAVLIFPGRPTYMLTIGLSLAIVSMWALSRTVGVPIGPEAGVREPVGVPDVMTTMFEILTVLAVLPLVGRREAPDRPRRRTRRGWTLTYALAGGLSLYIIGLTVVAVVPAVTGHVSESPITADSADLSEDSRGHAAHQSPPSTPAARVELTANQLTFGTSRLNMAAGRGVKIYLENLDDVAHNFSLYEDPLFGKSVFRGDMTTGDSSRTYEFRSPAAGRYWFRCDAHPFMKGKISFS